MARPRKYASEAARQAAFRHRSVVVERAGLEQLRTLLERLQAAGRQASRHGDELAGQVCGATAETTLLHLCEYWEAQVRLAPVLGSGDSQEGGMPLL